MPITPQFSITQTETHVLLHIRVPHVRVTPESVQVAVTDDSVLHFASPPYLLLLSFAPHAFHETAEESCATYEPTIENGMIQLKLRKAGPGFWKDLDLLGKLAPAKKAAGTAQWLQEVQQNEEESSSPRAGTSPDTTPMTDYAGYGFLRMFHGIFTDLAKDGLAKEMLEQPWEEQGILADDASIRRQRHEQRLEMEETKFSAERYIGDLQIQDDYIYQCAMAMRPHWQSETTVEALEQQLSSLQVNVVPPQDSGDSSFFTSEERTQLMAIPYPLLPSSVCSDRQRGLCLGLLDLLFAYSYDHLITDGDPTVESAWSVTILSASLAWLEDWLLPNETVRSVVVSSLRRSLVYPYLRNLEFGCFVWTQVASILRQGVRCVVRCLLQTRTILHRSDVYYLGTKLYVDPYLKWLQAHAEMLSSELDLLANAIEDALSDDGLKSELGLDLLRVEASMGNEDLRDSESSDESSDGDSDSSSEDGSTSDSSSSDVSSEDAQAVAPSETEASRSSELLDSNLVDAANPTVLDIVASPPADEGEASSRQVELMQGKTSLIEEIE